VVFLQDGDEFVPALIAMDYYERHEPKDAIKIR
jgi:hypothetical protein